MKFNININQQRCKEVEPRITIIEAVLMDVIYGLCSSVSEAIDYYRIEKEGKKYTWISYSHLLAELPLLRGRTAATITPIVKRLEDWGLIKTVLGKVERRKYFKITEKGEGLFRKLNDPIWKTKRPHLENQTYQVTKEQDTNTKVTPAGNQTKTKQTKNSAQGIPEYIETVHYPPVHLEPGFDKKGELTEISIMTRAPKKLGAKFSLSSVEPSTRNDVPRKLKPEFTLVLDAFKKGDFNNCNTGTKSIKEGIPRAVKIFETYYPGKGKEELARALGLLFQSDLYSWMQDKQPLSLSPKVIFSKTFVEDKLLTLVNKTYGKKFGEMAKYETSNEKRREIEDTNKRNIEQALAESN